MIYEIAVFHIHPNKRADFMENARTVIAHALKEADCLSYELASSITEPDQFVLVARWASREALHFHQAKPHYRDWMRVAADYVADSRVEVVYPERVEEIPDRRSVAGGSVAVDRTGV